MLKLRTDDKLYIVEMLLLFGICLNTLLHQSDVVSTLFKWTFVVLLIAFLLQIYHKQIVNELHLLAVATILLSFLHVAIRTDVNTFAYYKKFVMFSCTVLMLPFVDGIRVKRSLVNWILAINLGIALLYPVFYWGYGIRGWHGRYITLYFSNPNLTAMYLMHSLLYGSIAFYYFKHWLMKLLILPLIGALLWLDYLTGARSTYVAIAAFAGFSFANTVLKKDIRISPEISAVLLWMPLILAVSYLIIHKSGLLDRFFAFMDIGEGKSLTSRVSIWNRAIENFVDHPIMGAYYEISYGTGVSQLHNTHLDTLASYGMVPFLLFIFSMQRTVKKILPTATTSFARMALFAFFAAIIQGTFEAALVAGSGVGLYIMSFGFLLLAKYNEQQDEKRTIRFVMGKKAG